MFNMMVMTLAEGVLGKLVLTVTNILYGQSIPVYSVFLKHLLPMSSPVYGSPVYGS